MQHYYTAPATSAAVEYLRNGGREFYTRKEPSTQELRVHFLATEEYVAKMTARPFLKGLTVTRKA